MIFGGQTGVVYVVGVLLQCRCKKEAAAIGRTPPVFGMVVRHRAVVMDRGSYDDGESETSGDVFRFSMGAFEVTLKTRQGHRDTERSRR